MKTMTNHTNPQPPAALYAEQSLQGLGNPTYYAPVLQQNPLANPVQQNQIAPTQKGSTERWLGEVVLGVFAAILILVGILLFEDIFLKDAPVIAFVIACIYSLAVGAFALFAASRRPATDNARRVKTIVSIATCELMLFIVGAHSTWAYSEASTIALFGALLLVLKAAPLPGGFSAQDSALRINELVIVGLAVLYGLFSGIAGGPAPLAVVVLLGIFLACCAVLLGLRALDLAKPDMPRPAQAFPVLLAIATTALTLSYIFDISQIFVSPYVWSAVCMVCALIATGAGFWFGEKPLRLYGLITTLLCVFKIVVLDVNGNLLAHAIALVVGGLVCLAICVLYNHAAKRTNS